MNSVKYLTTALAALLMSGSVFADDAHSFRRSSTQGGIGNGYQSESGAAPLELNVNQHSAKNFQVGMDVSYQTFYDELSPYGDWIPDQDYGYVWRPSVPEGFMPYRTEGYWAPSDAGWAWMSNYRWGWAPFHYGRWRFDDYMGWVWIPGREWAPAWVVWSTSNDYYGWAPMAPGWNVNASVNLRSVPSNYWVFAPPAYLTNRRLYDYCAPMSRNVTIVRNVTYVNNVHVYNNARYSYGPRITEYNRVTGYKINPVVIREGRSARDVRYDSRSLYVYRPAVRAGDDKQAYRPSNVRDRAEFKAGARPMADNDRRGSGSQPNRESFRGDVERERINRNDSWGNRERPNDREKEGPRPNSNPGNRAQEQRNRPTPPSDNRAEGQVRPQAPSGSRGGSVDRRGDDRQQAQPRSQGQAPQRQPDQPPVREVSQPTRNERPAPATRQHQQGGESRQVQPPTGERGERGGRDRK